jgi:hypothetical protein
MQTFLPYPDFKQSVSVLDDKRLGKQRVEAGQIYSILTESKRAWRHHPAVLMWKGYEQALALYYNYTLEAWTSRGFTNTLQPKSISEIKLPWWLGDPNFHASHRSNLLRKWPEYYSQFGWTELPDLDYFWPVEI